MEIRPDFDAGEVARTVALAVTSLHNRTQSSDSGNDNTPLIRKRGEMSGNADSEPEDKLHLVPTNSTRCSRCLERIPARYILTMLGFLGFCNVYALRVNLSVAMVAMVNHSAGYNSTPEIYECSENIQNKTAIPKEGEFDWSSNTQATILGSFFYGYLITQIPGGRMAEKIGGKWLFGVGVLITSILTLLTPIAARWGPAALIALRICEGLGEGVTFPAMHAMLGAWLPKYERSMLCTIIYSGAQIGTVIAMPISGVLCDSDTLGGWPSVFYVFGTLGCIWFLFWAIFVYETPDRHPRISKAELNLIQTGKLEDERGSQPAPIPWKSILTSVPVWTLMITHFGQNWGFYTFLTELPTYLSSILHFDIKSDGFLSALPYLLQAIVSWITSFFADWVRGKKYFTISTIRKVSNSIGFLGPAICLVGVILAGCNSLWSVVFLTLAMGFNGCTYSGYMVTHVDMAPDYAGILGAFTCKELGGICLHLGTKIPTVGRIAGTLMGMTNAFATFAGFLAPKAVGALTENNETLGQWKIVFIIAIVVYVLTGLLFVICGSAKLQKWGSTQPDGKFGGVKSGDKTSDLDEK